MLAQVIVGKVNGEGVQSEFLVEMFIEKEKHRKYCKLIFGIIVVFIMCILAISLLNC